jgi:16S rRNA (uracil1498-N3)-methyltransferase
VLRLKPGDAVEPTDPVSGTVYGGVIEGIHAGVTVRLDTHEQPPAGELPIILVCALCKGPKNDLICDWATELGATQIVLWQAKRSVVRLDDADTASRQKRLLKIALAAAQQSRQPRPPAVSVHTSLTRALHSFEATAGAHPAKLLCSLCAHSRPIQEILATANNYSAVQIVIGPEGDLTPEEQEILTEHGFVHTSLGSHTLRSELAVVTALIAVKLSRTVPLV